MKKQFFLSITIAILLFCGNAFAQTKQTDDEKAIYAVLTTAGTAWEAGDMTKFAATLSDDCLHVNPFGKVFTGRDNIKTMLQWVRTEIYKNQKVELKISETTLRFLGPDTAIVLMKMVEIGKTSPSGVGLLETFTLTRVANEWKISSFQGIEISDPPKSAAK